MVKVNDAGEIEQSEKPATLPKGHVKVRVLPMGHEKVYTGETDPLTLQPGKHPKGATVALPHEIATTLEDRGYVEIL
jgi:hypothetical protein